MVIRLNAVSKHHPSPHGVVQALQDVTLQVKAGEIFGIIGKSGAGKSTLLRCMNGLDHPTHGQVFVNGTDLHALDNNQRRLARQQIGMIFQHFNLLRNRTVYNNIALPLELQNVPAAECRARVNELLELVHLNDKRDVYPASLSGGQKQRVAIARALATKPSVLLCDEATSALDPQTTTVILNLLKELHTQLDLTIVLITHELDVVKQICDRVAVLDKGSIVEIGDTLDVFTRPQHPATQELIAAKRHLPHSILDRMVDKHDDAAIPLLLLTFFGVAHAQPIIAQLIQRYTLNLSILQADIESIHGQSVGTMLVECPAEATVLGHLIEYLQDHQVQVEILGYVTNATQ